MSGFWCRLAGVHGVKTVGRDLGMVVKGVIAM
jgi:hypothetical protein